MDSQIISGLFALTGALLGGLISYATTRIDRRWGRAKRQIAQLCDQVSAYHQLEKLYKEKLANLDSDFALPATDRASVKQSSSNSQCDTVKIAKTPWRGMSATRAVPAQVARA